MYADRIDAYRQMIESVGNGTDVFITKGRLEKVAAGTGHKIVNTINEERWRHEN